MDGHRKGSRCRHARILLSEGSSCSIAGICEGTLAALLEGFIELLEGDEWEVDLTAYFDEARMGLSIQALWQTFDRLHIEGDILTRGAIAARESTDQHPILIEQVDRKTIDFDLTEPGGRDLLLNPLEP